MTSSPPTETQQWVLAKPPQGLPTYEGADPTFRLETAPLPALQPDQILCRARYFANDAGQRGFIATDIAPERYYIQTVPVGAPMRAGCLAEVVASTSASHQVGDTVATLHLGTWSTYFVLNAADANVVAPLPNGLPVTHYLGVFGGSGLAAYTGVKYAAEAKASDTVVVSAAAGATGALAVQVALRLVGCKRVVGIAGSDDKCAWVRDVLGAHACVNYKSPTFLADLKAATPDDVDVYFDNVGGAVLDAVLARMRTHGRVAVCGSVSSYNSDAPTQLRNWFEVVNSRISIRGFILLDWADQIPAILQDMIGAAADGRLVLPESSETVVEVDIDGVPDVWLRLFSGGSQGKLVTKLR